MKLAIHEIAQIYSGVSFRGKIKADKGGDVHIIQLRDLAAEYTAIGGGCLQMKRDKVSPKHLLEKGDVLFIAKGNMNNAVLYSGEPALAAATSVFFIIRPNLDLVKPRYMQWYLNLPHTQKLIKLHQSGTYTPSVKKEVLGELQIPLPKLVLQEKISRLYVLGQLEGQILFDLREKRGSYINALLLESIENENL